MTGHTWYFWFDGQPCFSQPDTFFFNNITTAVINVQFVTISGSLMSSLYTSWIVNWIRNIF